MKRPIPTVIVSGLLAVAPALSTAAEATLRLDIDAGSRLVPVGVVQTPTDHGIVVAGRIEKRWSYRGRILGHVDADLLNQDGDVIVARQGALVGRSPSARNPDRARFSVEFDSLPTGARAIGVRHHVGSHAENSFSSASNRG